MNLKDWAEYKVISQQSLANDLIGCAADCGCVEPESSPEFKRWVRTKIQSIDGKGTIDIVTCSVGCMMRQVILQSRAHGHSDMRTPWNLGEDDAEAHA